MAIVKQRINKNVNLQAILTAI